MQNIYPTALNGAAQPVSYSAPGPFGADGLDFFDLLDLVNPLHHIPVVGHVYRRVTGDQIAPALRVGGGALFGGPVGAALAAGGVLLDRLIDSDQPREPASAPQPAGPAGAPGGWMVATSRRPAAADSEMPAKHRAPGGTVAAPTRRGGWMAAAAYAMTDELAANRQSERQAALHRIA